MPFQDQLEIIRADGLIEFYDLDPAQGVTNIGRHPENHIVIDSPGVMPFHAVLDHRQRPYHLMVLGESVDTRLGGQPLPAHVSREVHNWDTLEFDGHSIILLEGGATGVGPGFIPTPVPQPLPERPTLPATGALVPVPPPATTALTPSAMGQQAPRPTLGRAMGRFPAMPADRSSETIVTELSPREWTVDVDQTAVFQLSVANGGAIVATFEARVDGLDPDWVTITPPQVNLNEGGRAMITIAITPPRAPSSRAGMHHFAIVVVSPNYPREHSQRGATLTVNPYYEFTMGDLAPKQQTVSWSRPTGQVALPIINKGNSSALVRLEGTDDERVCNFEFLVPGEVAGLAMQAETRLPSEETAAIPIRITPRSRRLIGLRKRTHSFTITSTLLEGAQTPRMVLGQLKVAPLIGFWHILLMSLLLVTGLVFLFIPGGNPRLWSEQGGRVAASDNQVTLDYNVARFKDFGPDNILNRINSLFLQLKLERKLADAPDNTYDAVGTDPLHGPTGTASDAPVRDVVYRLTVENWLTLFFPRLAQSVTCEVDVVPVLPVVKVSPEQKDVQLGQSVTLTWTVEYADRLVLKTQDGLVVQTFDKPEPSGSLEVKPPEAGATYVLAAYNLYTGDTPETAASVIKVIVPPPAIEFFIAQPDSIVVGTPVALNWHVTGADSASLGSDDPSDRPMEVAPEGPAINRQPTRTTLFTLKAVKKTAGGEATAVASQRVIVAPAPTPTPTPAAPEIIYFTASPDELVRSDENLTTLKWSIAGTTTNVEISGPSLNSPISNLKQEDAISVTIQDTTLFVLAAFNQDKKSSQNVQVRMKEPTPTPTPVPTGTPTPVPGQILVFEISSPGSPQVVDLGGSPHRYQVQVNTNVTFRWQTSAATTKVTFAEPGGDTETGAVPTGQTSRTISRSGTYNLVAENATGQQTAPQFIEITVVDRPPPRAPYNVLGYEDPAAGTNQLSWRWENESGRSPIVGFRVYRATVPGGSFALIPGADENSLAADANPKEYTDSVSPTCGHAYYVVAVYRNLQDDALESPASTNSWYSLPCP
jgi:pSer/pThr/pTyr-binding forkhead associated (FHA) protein